MKKITLMLAMILMVMLTQAQTLKSYTGAFTVGNSEGTATYQYTEDAETGARVFNGKFSYSGKIADKLIETISGNYKDNLKDGLWNYNTKTVPGLRTAIEQKFSGSYKDGFPDGTWTLNSLTKFVTGTEYAGKSLTGATITINGTANYKNKHLVGAFNFENKQTGDNIQPSSVQGSFDENGLMNGKWIFKFARQINGQIWEETRDYQNGILVHKRQLDPQSGETTNEDNKDAIKLQSLSYDPSAGLFISSENFVYIADTISAEDENSSVGSLLFMASEFFCKADKEDHYHKNTKGCVGCSYFKKLLYRRVLNNKIADEPFSKGEFKKAAKIYEYFIKADPENAGLNYSNLSWTNCLMGNFQENIIVCKEGLKVAIGDNKNTILKNLGHSYLLTNQYDEAKKCYLEFANNDFTFLLQVLNKNFDFLKSKGFYNSDCDKIKIEVQAKIDEQKEKIFLLINNEMEKLAKYQDVEGMKNILNSNSNILTSDDKVKYELMISKAKKELQEDIEIETKGDLLYKTYIKDNIVQKQTLFVDASGKPIMKDDYPRGEYLYLKSKMIIDIYRMDYMKEEEIVKRLSLGNKYIETIEKLNLLTESECKDLNKQLKKVEDPEQIKAILKI